MLRISRYLTLFLLSIAFIAPPKVQAGPAQYGRQVVDSDRNRDNKHLKRYHDRYHKDYHTWDNREDRAYRHWMEERREAYRDFAKQRREQQEDYWNWRHDHPEYDRR